MTADQLQLDLGNGNSVSALLLRPDTARAPHMALSALKLRPADCVLTLNEIAGVLQTLDASPTPMRMS